MVTIAYFIVFALILAFQLSNKKTQDEANRNKKNTEKKEIPNKQTKKKEKKRK